MNTNRCAFARGALDFHLAAQVGNPLLEAAQPKSTLPGSPPLGGGRIESDAVVAQVEHDPIAGVGEGDGDVVRAGVLAHVGQPLLGGAQQRYGVTPDLSTFGKALANGFALSALAGRREIMRLGSREREQDQVFLLSTTHGAETPALAAAIRTMEIYASEPVVERLHAAGEKLRAGIDAAAHARGVESHVVVMGRACNLFYATYDAERQPSQAYRALFLQETIKRGVLMPSLVVSYSHSDDDIARTVEAVDGALAVYARALEDGVDRHLVGPPTCHVFDRRW